MSGRAVLGRCGGFSAVDIRRDQDLAHDVEQARQLLAELRQRLAVSQRWSRRWRALAHFRGWPASRHERARQRNKKLEEALRTIASAHVTATREREIAAEALSSESAGE